ncbi:MAG: hypothetical protein M3010_07495, partial [Candidatus Dormibacteraeota bacterium]|nr:hypothetical protein [Candidatus Dormibacteraeota bacterium]
MILSLQAFAPAALLLGGGLLLLLRPSATIYVVVQALTLAALLRLSQIATAAVTVPLYDPLADAPLILRLDRLSIFFATSGVLAALLVSLPWIGDHRPLPFGWLALAQFGSVCAITAGNLQGLAAGWGMAVAALLMLVVMPRPLARELRRPSRSATRNLVLQLAGAVLVLTGAVAVEATAGTTSYDAVPTGALDSRTGLLLVAGPVVALATTAGLARLCRGAGSAALMLTGVTLPMAVYVLARTFDLAGGHPLGATPANGLALSAGMGAALFAVSALWAPDLGATIGRGLNALALTLVAAFALGGATGLAALVLGFISLEAVAAASLVMLDAGHGRLPGRGRLPRWALGGGALLPLVALGGVVVGLALDARMLLLRRVVEMGLPGIALGTPLGVAALGLLAAALAAARFGGGRVESRRGSLQVAMATAVLLATGLWAPVLRDLAVAIAAASARVPVAEVRSSVLGALPGV